MIHLDPPPTGPWVESWLSKPRLTKYLAASAGHPQRALELYEWNSQVSAALMRDLAHIEVALRNAYAEAIDQYWAGRSVDWTRSATTLFAPLIRNRNGHRVDINTQHREQLLTASARVRPTDPPGKIIAELPFGFWRYLSSAAHEKTVWVRYLHRAFPPGTDRKRDVDNVAAALNRLRNRVAHHEPLIDEDLIAASTRIIRLATLLNNSLGRYVAATSTVAPLVRERHREEK
jgi:hypothetical protein